MSKIKFKKSWSWELYRLFISTKAGLVQQQNTSMTWHVVDYVLARSEYDAVDKCLWHGHIADDETIFFIETYYSGKIWNSAEFFLWLKRFPRAAKYFEYEYGNDLTSERGITAVHSSDQSRSFSSRR